MLQFLIKKCPTLFSLFFDVENESNLDKPLFYLTRGTFSKKNLVTFRQACSGIHVFGSSGSGKTSTSAKNILEGLFRNNCGGCILTAKQEDVESCKRLAAQNGRSCDLVVVDESYTNCFNFLDYSTKNNSSYVENVTHLFIQISQIISGSTDKSDDKFWEESLKMLLRALINVIGLSDQNLSVTLMQECLDNLMSYFAIHQEEIPDRDSTINFISNTILGQIILEAGDNAQTESQKGDLKTSTEFLINRLFSMPEKTVGSVVAMFNAMSDTFLRDPLRTLLCGNTDFQPEECYTRNKIILLALPTSEHEMAGRILQITFKLIFQKAMKKRDIRKYPASVFLFIDEYQEFLTETDREYLNVIRSYRVINVLLSQSLPTYYSVIPGNKGKSIIDSILSNCALKIFHNLSCKTSAQYASELIGKIWNWRYSINEGTNRKEGEIAGTNFSNGESMSQQIEYRVQPIEFTQLRTGSPANKYKVDAIVLHSGRKFDNGTNLLRTTIGQDQNK